MFKQKEAKSNKTKEEKIKNQYAFKKGGLSIAVTAIFIAVLVALNILITVLCQKFPMDIDFSSGALNTISDQNAEFLESIQYDVKLTVVATEEEYLGGYLQQVYNAYDETGKYFSQTINLLKQYPKYNNRISLNFVDPYSEEFSDISTRLANSSVSVNDMGFGDILVECDFNFEGKDYSKKELVAFADIYTLTDDSGMAAYGYSSYSVTASDLESALASALSYVISPQSPKVGILSSYSMSGATEKLESTFKTNNYVVESVGLLKTSDISGFDALVLAGPTADFSAEEISVLEKFLLNDGNYGKHLLLLANSSAPDLPNLYAFAEEWGIRISSEGTLYTTDENSSYSDSDENSGTNLFHLSNETDYSERFDNAGYLFISDSNLPLSVVFDSYGNKTTETILSTQTSSAVIKPKNAGSDWNPSLSVGQEYPTVIISNASGEESNSSLTVFSSLDFIMTDFLQYTDVGNVQLAVNTLNIAGGFNEDSVFFDPRIIDTDRYVFESVVSNANALIVQIIFIVIIPVGLIVLGIVCWRRRKSL